MDKIIESGKNNSVEKNNVSNSPKFVLIAGHDNSLGLNDLFLKHEFGLDFDRAVYSHSHAYELWKNESDNKYYIRYLVNQKQKFELEYEKFKEKVKSKLYSSEKIEEICNSNQK